MATELTPLSGPRQLGSWTLFCDIAGQMSEKSDGTVVTLAAVGVAREVVSTAHRKLTRAFDDLPVKWKTGRLEGLQRVVNLIVSLGLPAAVSQVHRGDSATWVRFFDQAKAFIKAAEEKVGERLPYLEPDAALRMNLLTGAFAKLMGWILRARLPRNTSKPAILDVELVLDTDISNAEAREWFTTWLEQDWPKQTRLISDLNVYPQVRARFSKEEDEPLLLLPDYLAGVYHHADPRARLGAPVAEPDEASKAVLDFRRRHGPLLYEDTEDFNDEYPLDHDKGGDVVQRATGRPGRSFLQG